MRQLFVIVYIVAITISVIANDKIYLPIHSTEGSGYIDTNGAVKYWNEEYLMTFDFSDGMAMVEFTNYQKGNNGKFYSLGFINTKFELIIRPGFDDVRDFKEDRAAVKINDKWGFIDKEGNIVVEPIYKRIRDYSDGLATVVFEDDNNKRWGAIDKNGKYIIPLSTRPFRAFSEGLAIVEESTPDNYYYIAGFINKTNNIVIDFNFRFPEDFSDGFAAVGIGEFPKNTNAFIDKSGKIKFNDVKKDYVRSFHEGLAPISREGKWGFMNLDGEIVIDCIYDEVKFFNNGLAAVTDEYTITTEQKWGFIDTKGKLVLPLIYRSTRSFKNGIAFVEIIDEDDVWGSYNAYINKKGEIIWDFRTSLEDILINWNRNKVNTGQNNLKTTTSGSKFGTRGSYSKNAVFRKNYIYEFICIGDKES